MILSFNKLETLRDQKTVYTAGSFDLFHRGHVEYLKAIKEKYPDHKLVLGLLPDKRIAAKKGSSRPIIKQNDRLAVIDAIKYVDYTFICPIYKGGQDATFIILEKLRPEFVVFPQKKYLKLQGEFAKTGSKIIIQERKPHTSTSTIIEKIKKSA